MGLTKARYAVSTRNVLVRLVVWENLEFADDLQTMNLLMNLLMN